MSTVSTRRSALRAAIPAAVLSGIPSTLHALWTRRDPVEASLAAGSIVLPREQRRLRLLIAAAAVHAALSAGWAVMLAASLPRRNVVAEGALAGLAIAGFDLGIVGRRYPRIRALPLMPQVVDHLAFGVIVSVALARQENAA